MRFLLLSLLLTVGLFSCTDQFEKDTDAILEYLETNNLDAEVTPEGIYYIITTEGTGDNPTATDEVEVNYTGYFLDGQVFDANDNISFGLNQVIPGWTIGVQLLKEGGSGTLLIPSELGYGSNARPGIPANSVLVFDIDLLDIK